MHKIIETHHKFYNFEGVINDNSNDHNLRKHHFENQGGHLEKKGFFVWPGSLFWNKLYKKSSCKVSCLYDNLHDFTHTISHYILKLLFKCSSVKIQDNDQQYCKILEIQR